jgi:phosphoadenosine phosphosulfate reductase
MRTAARIHGLMVHTASAPVSIDATLAARAEAASALLRRAVSDYGRVIYANSLGAEAMVLTDLICTSAPEIDMFSIDTGRLPEETLTLLDRLERRYQRRVALYYPDAQAVARYVNEHGINGFYNDLGARLSCCQIRKLEPFKRAVAGYRAWVTGVRRAQSDLRAAAQPIAHDPQHGLEKVSPLLDWSESDIWTYIRAKQLPYNPLHDRGYSSIGCAPCSRATTAGEEHRAGRWWWEHSESRECGLHPRQRPAAVG